MPVFVIPCKWKVEGVMNLVGDRIEEAIEKAKSGDYGYPVPESNIEGSLEINLEMIEYFNPGVKVPED